MLWGRQSNSSKESTFQRAESTRLNIRIDNHHGVGRQQTSDHTKYILKTQQLSCLWEAENAESRISISLWEEKKPKKPLS